MSEIYFSRIHSMFFLICIAICITNIFKNILISPVVSGTAFKIPNYQENSCCVKILENLSDPDGVDIYCTIPQIIYEHSMKNIVHLFCSCMRFVKLVACWLMFAGNA